MPIPSITPLPPAPSRASDPANFAAEADAHVAALTPWTTQVNAVSTYLNGTFTTDMTALKDAAAASATASATSATASASSATASATSASNAASSASAAATSAASAVNSPSTQATSSTSLAVGIGTRSLTLNEMGKSFVVGQWVQINLTSAPASTWMSGAITAYNPATGDMTVDVKSFGGTSTHSNWTVAQGMPVSVIQPEIGECVYAPYSSNTAVTPMGARLLKYGTIISYVSSTDTLLGLTPYQYGHCTQRVSGTTDTIRSVASNSDGTMIYALDGGVSGAQPLRSINGGVSWTRITGNASAAGREVANFGTTWLASRVTIGTGGVYRSTDNGSTWAYVALPSADIVNGIAFKSASNVVAVGDAGKIFTSSDGGATWATRTSGITTALNSVVWFDLAALWIAVGDSSRILTSPDGITWTSRTSANTGTLRDVAVSPTEAVIVAYNAGSDSTDYIQRSTNGITWVAAASSLVTKGFYAVVWNGTDSFIMRGARRQTVIGSGTTWALKGELHFDLIYGAAKTSETNVIFVGSDGYIGEINAITTMTPVQARYGETAQDFNALVNLYVRY